MLGDYNGWTFYLETSVPLGQLCSSEQLTFHNFCQEIRENPLTDCRKPLSDFLEENTDCMELCEILRAWDPVKHQKALSHLEDVAEECDENLSEFLTLMRNIYQQVMSQGPVDGRLIEPDPAVYPQLHITFRGGDDLNFGGIWRGFFYVHNMPNRAREFSSVEFTSCGC